MQILLKDRKGIKSVDDIFFRWSLVKWFFGKGTAFKSRGAVAPQIEALEMKDVEITERKNASSEKQTEGVLRSLMSHHIWAQLLLLKIYPYRVDRALGKTSSPENLRPISIELLFLRLY